MIALIAEGDGVMVLTGELTVEVGLLVEVEGGVTAGVQAASVAEKRKIHVIDFIDNRPNSSLLLLDLSICIIIQIQLENNTLFALNIPYIIYFSLDVEKHLSVRRINFQEGQLPLCYYFQKTNCLANGTL